MKKPLLSLLLILGITQLKAQSFELSLQANTGSFHYTGSSSASNSFILQDSPRLRLDIMPGIDMAYGSGSHENGKATASNNYTTDIDHGNP